MRVSYLRYACGSGIWSCITGCCLLRIGEESHPATTAPPLLLLLLLKKLHCGGGGRGRSHAAHHLDAVLWERGQAQLLTTSLLHLLQVVKASQGELESHAHIQSRKCILIPLSTLTISLWLSIINHSHITFFSPHNVTPKFSSRRLPMVNMFQNRTEPHLSRQKNFPRAQEPLSE